MHKKNKKYISVRRGFSLIEGAVAILVLSVGILAISGMFTRSLSQSALSGRSVTAVGLAQEGVELVRVLRNDDLVKGTTEGIFKGIDVAGGKNSAGVMVKGNFCRIKPVDSSDHLNAAMGCDSTYTTNSYLLGIRKSGLQVYVYGVTSGSTGTADTTFPLFWRRIYIVNKTAGGIEKREVVSVVFYRQPANDAAWPANTNTTELAKCTAQKSCVFSRALLQ